MSAPKPQKHQRKLYRLFPAVIFSLLLAGLPCSAQTDAESTPCLVCEDQQPATLAEMVGGEDTLITGVTSIPTEVMIHGGQWISNAAAALTPKEVVPGTGKK